MVAIIGAVVGTRLPSSRPADGSGDVLRLAIGTLEGVPVDAGFGGRGLAISPDGTQIVYVGSAIDGGFGTNLYRRALRRLGWCVGPVLFSRWRVGGVRRESWWPAPEGPDRGRIQELVAVMPAGIRGASWHSSNQIIVGGVSEGLAELPADGGDPTSLTTLDANRAEVGHYSPAVTPDGRGVLFVIREAARTEVLAVLDRATGQVTRLGLAGTNSRYVSSGHLVYVSPDGTLTAVSFDPERLELQGRPVAVVEGLLMGNLNIGAPYGVSDAGRLVYVSGTAGELELAWVDRSGRTIGRIEDQPVGGWPSLSRDGRRLAFIDATATVAILDLDRGGAVKLSEGGTAFTPAWSADGSAVTYSSTRETTINLYSRPVDFSGPEELLLERPESLIAGGWSSDGQTFVYYQTTGATNRDIWALLPNGETRPLRATEFNELAPRLSPDGRWVAFVSNQDGRNRIYMQPLSGGRLVPVSTGPGNEPVWSRDGRELFYRDDDRMMVVDVVLGPDATVGTPRVLFEGRFATDPSGVGIANYDVALDGQSFIMVTDSRGDDGMPPTMALVENWFEELKARVPVP